MRDARARALGQPGEGYVCRAERHRLSAEGKDNLARQVRWVSKEGGASAGYYILSFSKSGERRLLRVKTTNGPKRTPFCITENERRLSEKRKGIFRLTGLYDFSTEPKAFRLRAPLEAHVKLTPTHYRAAF